MHRKTADECQSLICGLWKQGRDNYSKINLVGIKKSRAGIGNGR